MHDGMGQRMMKRREGLDEGQPDILHADRPHQLLKTPYDWPRVQNEVDPVGNILVAQRLDGRDEAAKEPGLIKGVYQLAIADEVVV